MNNINFFNGKLFLTNSAINAQNVWVSGIPVSAENLTESLYKRLLEAEREKVNVLKAALNHEFPVEKLVSEYYVTEEQATEMLVLIETLAHKYKLTHIQCFARKGTIAFNFSAFADIPSFTHLHYFLLFVTQGPERVEHEIQQYINTHYKSFKVTAIAHSFENVRHAIAQGNRFFVAAFVGGLEMYHDQVTIFDIAFPKLNPETTLQKAERRYHDHLKIAFGFLYSSANCIRLEEYFENGVFLLHQAVEQACIALIKVHMGYRIDLHNLYRLLNLCKCFSDKPAGIFLSENTDSIRLFQLLSDSYGNARYKEDFHITKEDAIKLLERVDAFVNVAENLCLDWLNARRISLGGEALPNTYSVNESKD
ncbi:HEPN domain-containing protein [Mucilaginibacter robiniae]|uniref:HEPN domain-containing protein n=1 Tax=Mucilaginibacter robiniae TaxID=2728022 RepID=A0A7L5E511_9SPHI|nr:HEPN domain-containing protein [Mucilaginibacter robiniae]QJD97708.1 HEPN domain-containing protein [Mucilaginibacter robiniae]